MAGLGGFSGRESSVSVSWLAQEVSAGHLRWVLLGATGSGPGLPGDTRQGSTRAFDAVQSACRAVPVSASTSATGGFGATSAGATTLYDCRGRGAAIARTASA